MFRFWKAPLIAVMALGTMLISAPQASAARVVFRGGFRGGFYGGGWYGPGWGWGYGPAWYGPGFYGGWGYGPPEGKVKIETPDKSAAVFVDGGYVGPVAKAKKFDLPPGNHDLELRDPNGQTVYRQEVNIARGHTTEVVAAPPPRS